ncbi:hypothetical protein RBS60_11005 [Sinomonas sp. ASV486]|uniref:hypothetical protein n=1 Tax=Sinomonas sp. ASV486 TaxID=3051170 RepID=UPI0027DC06F1|nr:hypothetical protein [Sinomonas sp. ASV486]MDQ4490726.1 hypothetical protein [Sinomonas sp. ASV486]
MDNTPTAPAPPQPDPDAARMSPSSTDWQHGDVMARLGGVHIVPGIAPTGEVTKGPDGDRALASNLSGVPLATAVFASARSRPTPVDPEALPRLGGAE